MEISGVFYLRVDLGQPCSGPRYTGFVWINIAMIAITQMIPLFYLWRCYRLRDELNPKIAGSLQARLKHRRKHEHLPALQATNFLWRHYSCDWWMFEVIEAYRRCVYV